MRFDVYANITSTAYPQGLNIREAGYALDRIEIMNGFVTDKA